MLPTAPGLQSNLTPCGCRGRWGAADVQAAVQLHQELAELLRPSPQASAQLGAAWRPLLPVVLHGAACAGAATHLAQLDAAHAALPLVLAAVEGASSLWELAGPPGSSNCSTHHSHEEEPGQAYCGTLVGVLYLHLFFSDGEPVQCTGGRWQHPHAGVPPPLERLLSAALALPPGGWGADPRVAQATIQQAFEAVVATLQSGAVLRRLGEAQQAAAACSARRFLQHFLITHQPAVADAWWAAFGAVVHGLVALVQSRGAAVLARPVLAPLLRVLCCGDTAEMLVRYLLAHPAYGEATKDGPRKALDLLAALLQHDRRALLDGCAALLRPEANASLAARLSALQGGSQEGLTREHG